MRLTPEEIAAKASRNAAAASQDYTRGIERVTTAPGARAAAKKSQYVQNVQAAADKWAARTGAVTLSDWQQRTLAKSGRFAQGVAASEQKTAEFWRQFGPHLDSVTAKVRAMPNATMEDRINRATAQMRGAAEFKRR